MKQLLLNALEVQNIGRLNEMETRLKNCMLANLNFVQVIGSVRLSGLGSWDN